MNESRDRCRGVDLSFACGGLADEAVLRAVGIGEERGKTGNCDVVGKYIEFGNVVPSVGFGGKLSLKGPSQKNTIKLKKATNRVKDEYFWLDFCRFWRSSVASTTFVSSLVDKTSWLGQGGNIDKHAGNK